MNMISPALKNLVTQHLFLNVVNATPEFMGNSEVVEFIVLNIEALQFLPDEYVIK
jgi:hypothetical protein